MKKFIFLFSCLFSLLIGNGMAMEVEGKEAKTPEQKTKEAAAKAEAEAASAPTEWPEIAFLEDLIKSDTNSSSSSVASSTSSALSTSSASSTSSMEAPSSSSSSSVSQNNLNPLTKCLLKRVIQKYKKYAIALNAKNANVVEKEGKESLHNYSINLIWMTRRKDAKQTYIFPNEFQRSELNPRELLDDNNEIKQAEDEAQIHPSTDKEKKALTIGMKNTFLQSAIQWGLANPGVAVNIWYDSAFVTKEAVENTQKLITDTWGKFSSSKNPITLQDIRELNTVKENPTIFIETPIFYRVDLLRIVIALHLLSQQPTTQPYYFVYADLDVLPVPRKILFDAETVTSLKDAGMLLASGPENYFQIISNNKDLLEALDFAFVKLNLQRATYFIENDLLDDAAARAHLGEAPFKSYNSMFNYFRYLQGKGKLKVKDDKKNTLVDYDKDVHGLEPFNIRYYTIYGPSPFLELVETKENVRCAPPWKKTFGGHKNKIGYGL